MFEAIYAQEAHQDRIYFRFFLMTHVSASNQRMFAMGTLRNNLKDLTYMMREKYMM